MRTHPLVSLADLRTAGICLRPVEAVTIVRELALQVWRGELPGVPSAHVVRLSAEGGLVVEGPVAADGNAVSRIAHLLDSLLPGFDAPPELRASGALRLVVARALGTLDLPPYPSLQSVSDARAFCVARPRSARPRSRGGLPRPARHATAPGRRRRGTGPSRPPRAAAVRAGARRIAGRGSAG